MWDMSLTGESKILHNSTYMQLPPPPSGTTQIKIHCLSVEVNELQGETGGGGTHHQLHSASVQND